MNVGFGSISDIRGFSTDIKNSRRVRSQPDAMAQTLLAADRRLLQLIFQAIVDLRKADGYALMTGRP